MKINWLDYTIDVINLKVWHIQLNSYREDGSIANTYPVTYDTTPEIEELIEEVKETKRIEEFPDVDKDGNDFVNKKVVTDKTTVQVPTGKKIPNLNYFEPTSLKEIETWLVEKHWFTK